MGATRVLRRAGEGCLVDGESVRGAAAENAEDPVPARDACVAVFSSGSSIGYGCVTVRLLLHRSRSSLGSPPRGLVVLPWQHPIQSIVLQVRVKLIYACGVFFFCPLVAESMHSIILFGLVVFVGAFRGQRDSHQRCAVKTHFNTMSQYSFRYDIDMLNYIEGNSS